MSDAIITEGSITESSHDEDPELSATAATLSPHDLRRVAVECGADPRSVAAVLSGRRTRSTTRARVLAALKRLGVSR